jgi:alkylation response protein AidB-like acyl-CoA dehydrogenase
MADYKAPTGDILAAMKHGVGLDRLQKLQGQSETNEELLQAIFEEAAKFAETELAPLNEVGDQKPAKRNPDGSVTVSDGFAEAYKKFSDMGWNGLSFDLNHGGQGLPWSVNFGVQEMWQSANMAFGLCPMLTQGSVEAITIHGSKEQQDTYLEKLISGEWTGTMNLTEPQAGSDLAQVKTKAVKQADGSYLITGQKIYITFGEHEMSDNIVHMVLARTPDAPEGVKGISMFIVPKFIPDENGDPKDRNDLTCAGLEHKLGIHGSPTCTMQFGDKGGAKGFLIGKENEGLIYMFTMMNNARLAVGLQGVSIAERAYQHALSYAHERKQGTSLDTGKANAPIVEHADVQRLLAEMRSSILAGRLLTSHAVMSMDEANINKDSKAQQRVDILTPIVKSWCTDMGVDVASKGLQVFGGMGFIEETGAAQFYRDARILPIYEGTNGIQASDFTFRKTLRDGGKAMKEFAEEMWQKAEAIDKSGVFTSSEIFVLKEGVEHFRTSIETVLKQGADSPHTAAASAQHYLNLAGNVVGGIYLAEMAMNAKAAGEENDYVEQAKFFIHNNVSSSGYQLTKMKHNVAQYVEKKSFEPK